MRPFSDSDPMFAALEEYGSRVSTRNMFVCVVLRKTSACRRMVFRQVGDSQTHDSLEQLKP